MKVGHPPHLGTLLGGNSLPGVRVLVAGYRKKMNFSWNKNRDKEVTF
jgi:hypothetical protein